MLINISGQIALPDLMATVNNLSTEQLPQALGEFQALIHDDDFAKANGVKVNSFMLRGLRKEVVTKLVNLSSDESLKLQKWTLKELPSIFALRTPLNLEDFKRNQLDLSDQWAMFLTSQTKGAYFYNAETQAIKNYFDGHLVCYKIKSIESFWVEIARLIFELGTPNKK